MAKTHPTDGLTAAVPVKTEANKTPRVRVFIPETHDDTDGSVKVDHYEHVTIGGETTLVRRGQHVDVTVDVFLQLRNKYPHL